MTMQAVKDINSIDKNSLLGYMVFYHVPEIKISHKDLEQIFDNNKMEKASLPPKIYEHDAFRRATGKIRGTVSVNLSGENKDAKLNVDEVRNDKNFIVRALGRKVADSEHDSIDYETVGHMFFNKDTKQMTYNSTVGMDSEYNYQEILEETLNLFTDWINYHTKDTVRNIVNKIVKSMQPVNIIKGAYFIPKKEFDTVKGLKGIIDDLGDYASEEVPAMEIIPLLDTIEQRTMVEDRVNKEVMNDVDNLVFELSEMLTEGKDIHKRTINRVTCQFQELRDKTNTYATLLQTKMGAIEQQLSTAIDKFAKLQAKKDKNNADTRAFYNEVG